MKNKLIAILLSLATPSYGAIAVDGAADQDRLSAVVSGCPTSTNKATYTMWVYNGTGSPPAYMAIMESRSVSLQGIMSNAEGTPKFTCVWTGDEYSLSNVLVIPVNTWTFLACQIDGTARKNFMYNQSQSIGTHSYSHTNTTQDLNGTYVFGQDTAVPGSREFGGYLGEARIYGRALSDQEIESLARGLTSKVSTQGLCANWRFDEGLSGNVSGSDIIRDFSGNGNEASPIAGATSPTWVHLSPTNFE